MLFEAIINRMQQSKTKGYQRELRCCYHLCPSNTPVAGAYPPKMKFVQKVAPTVYQYRCKDCGCLMNNSVEITEQGQEVHKINPAFIGGKPSFRFWR